MFFNIFQWLLQIFIQFVRAWQIFIQFEYVSSHMFLLLLSRPPSLLRGCCWCGVSYSIPDDNKSRKCFKTFVAAYYFIWQQRFQSIFRLKTFVAHIILCDNKCFQSFFVFVVVVTAFGVAVPGRKTTAEHENHQRTKCFQIIMYSKSN